jgi:hypothetical protein
LCSQQNLQVPAYSRGGNQIAISQVKLLLWTLVKRIKFVSASKTGLWIFSPLTQGRCGILKFKLSHCSQFPLRRSPSFFLLGLSMVEDDWRFMEDKVGRWRHGAGNHVAITVVDK